MEDNLVSENKIFEMKMNTNLAGSNLNKVSSSSNNNKFYFYNQFPSNIREELDNHVWELISYNPIKFIVAHSENKQIVYTRLKEKVKKVKSDDFSLDYIEEKAWELEFSRVVIGAIPLDVNMIKNPLGLFDQKYIIKFLTHSGKLITIGPKSIDEIIMNLKEKSLLFLPSKATEALSIIISAFERNGQMLVKEDIGTSGFYFIDKKIKSYNNSHHPKPTLEQIVKCCELLEILQSKFKKKDVFPTLLKWSIVAPFDYIFKQVHKKWIPWLYPYGWSNTGKSTLGELCCCIWNRYLDKDAIISSTAVDTKARFGEVLSKSTYPILINEVAQLHDDKYRDMVEMFKTAITDLVARKKFVNKTIYTEIPSFSPCILTGNSIPPSDTGFRRRIIPIIFTEKDQYSKDEIKDFENLFEQRIMKELSSG